MPQKLQQKSPIDIEKKENGIAVIMLGNPLEEKKQVYFLKKIIYNFFK